VIARNSYAMLSLEILEFASISIRASLQYPIITGFLRLAESAGCCVKNLTKKKFNRMKGEEV
jgi:hypothetical protein